MNELRYIIELLEDILYLSSDKTKDKEELISEINRMSMEALEKCEVLKRRIRNLKKEQ